MISSTIRLTLLAALTLPALAEDPAAPTSEDWVIHVDLQILALPAKKGAPLASELQDDAKAAAAWKKLDALVTSGEAKVVGRSNSATTNNEPLTASSGEEVRYATDWNTPEEVADENAVPSVATTPPPRAVDASKSKGDAPPPAADKTKAVFFRPTNFEMRKTGLGLQADIDVSDDGQRLRLRTKVSNTRLVGWDELEVGRYPNGDKMLEKLPRFSVGTSESSLVMASGDRVLLSEISSDEDRVELFTLHVWTTPTKKAAK